MTFSLHKCLAAPFAAGAIALTAMSGLAAAEPVVQKITFVEDDAQKFMGTKIYTLKHTKAADLLPFIQNAVLRYTGDSHASSVNDFANNRQMIIVSTGVNFFPYLDEMVAALDRPGKMNKFGTNIDGDGVATGFYRPRFRAAASMVDVITKAQILSSTDDGAIYLDKGSNLFYFKEAPSIVDDIKARLAWFDQAPPQVRLEMKVYEVRDSDLRDIGIDYLAWKNGPGLNLFAAGYDALDFSIGQTMMSALTGAATDIFGTASWGFGGFYTAPAFDMSFVRILQQNGKATISSTAAVTLSNENSGNDVYRVAFAPEYQNITKDGDHRSAVGASADASLTAIFNGVSITNGKAGVVNFSYALDGNNVEERNNLGAEISSNIRVASSASLAMGQEKVLTSWNRTSKVEQTVGVPFLCELPVLKYIFGTTTTNIEKVHCFVTVRAVPVKITDSIPAGAVKEFDDVCKK